MGRWSQNSRTGGGPPIINYMIKAAISAADEVVVTYQQNVDASQLDAAAFESQPSAEVANLIVQITPTRIGLVFGADIDTDTSLAYTGQTPAIRSPQTISYT